MLLKHCSKIWNTLQQKMESTSQLESPSFNDTIIMHNQRLLFEGYVRAKILNPSPPFTRLSAWREGGRQFFSLTIPHFLTIFLNKRLIFDLQNAILINQYSLLIWTFLVKKLTPSTLNLCIQWVKSLGLPLFNLHWQGLGTSSWLVMVLNLF